MRHWLARGLVVAAAVGSSATAPLARQSARLSVREAVAAYSRGDFSAAVRDVDTQGLKVAPFTRALDEWIAEGDPAGRPRRHRIAAAFALDVNWAVTRTPWNREPLNRDPEGRTPPIAPERERLSMYYSQPLVAEWVGRQLPTTGVADSLERLVWLTALGLAEDGQAWHRLKDEILPLARKRLPSEPRVRLAEVLARTNIDLRTLRRGLRPWGRDILRNETSAVAPARRIQDAIRALEPLLADASLAGEVELRIGYLELRRKNWSAALTRFDAARSKTTEPALRATADYFAGWIFEQLDRADDAVAAYRRALAIAPTMRNPATRLSALLYLRNERAEAYSVLDKALNARPAPMDLMVAMERADARFVPECLAAMREALK